MKIKIALMLFIFFILIVRFPKRKLLQSPLKDGNYITVFRPFQFIWNNDYYVIPYNFDGLFVRPVNYFSVEPMSDQDMSVDWNPVNYKLVIQLPFCDSIQKVIYKIDTTKYLIVKYCGKNIDSNYIIPAKAPYNNGGRYSLFRLNEWLP